MNINIVLKVIIILVIGYFIYRLYQKQLINNTIKTINANAQKNIQITPETVFVFDIDGVILKPDLKKICKVVWNSPKLELIKLIFYPHLLYKIYKARGNETIDEVLNDIRQTSSHLKPAIEIIAKLNCSKKEITEICLLIKKLKKLGYKLLILSNESNIDIECLIKENSILELFDGMFLTTSTDDYLKKPNAKFFEKFLLWAGNRNINPRNLIFIDDRFKNVIIANKEGIPSIVFTNINELNQILFKSYYAEATKDK